MTTFKIHIADDNIRAMFRHSNSTCEATQNTQCNLTHTHTAQHDSGNTMYTPHKKCVTVPVRKCNIYTK
jgi:hypothetical protein